MAKINHEDILAYLEEATILELNDLVKAIEEKFGVTAAAPVAGKAGTYGPVDHPSEGECVLIISRRRKLSVSKNTILLEEFFEYVRIHLVDHKSCGCQMDEK